MNILYCPTISLSYSLTVTLSTVPSYSFSHTSKVKSPVYIHTYIAMYDNIIWIPVACTTYLPFAFSLLFLRMSPPQMVPQLASRAECAEEQVATAHDCDALRNSRKPTNRIFSNCRTLLRYTINAVTTGTTTAIVQRRESHAASFTEVITLITEFYRTGSEKV